MVLTFVMVGSCYLDTILGVDRYPNEDEKQRASSLDRRLGGNVVNTLQALQQLQRGSQRSFSSSLIATLPDKSSSATQQILTALGPDIDTSHCLYREDSKEAPSCYIIRSLATDSRTIVNYNDLSEMTFDEFKPVCTSFTELDDDIVYHFEGRMPETTIRAIDHLRQYMHSNSKVKISVEVEKPKRDGLRQLASKADVVFYSKSWAQAEGYRNAEDCLQAESKQMLRSALLFCTWGADGAACLNVSNSTFLKVAALPIEKAVDSVGAGDTFNAGVLFGLFVRRDWDLVKVLRFANELAGRKVSQEGFVGLALAMTHYF